MSIARYYYGKHISPAVNTCAMMGEGAYLRQHCLGGQLQASIKYGVMSPTEPGTEDEFAGEYQQSLQRWRTKESSANSK